MMRRILLVEDHPVVVRQVAAALEPDGYEVVGVPDGPTALERIRSDAFHLVISDWQMPGLEALKLIQTVHQERRSVGFVILTDSGDPKVALEAMKAGADDFVTRPYDPERLRFLVGRILDRRQLLDEVEQLRGRLNASHGFRDIVSKSPRMRRVFDLIERVGPLSATVLIHGETGTGKELVARAIHSLST